MNLAEPSGAPISELRQSASAAEQRRAFSDPEGLAGRDGTAGNEIDGWAKLCAKCLRVPITLVSLVDQRGRLIQGALGLPEPWASFRETPLSHAFCRDGVIADRPLRVNDVRDDASLRDDATTKGLDATAYLAVPLRRAGVAVGVLCAVDTVPHAWTDDDLELLLELGRGLETALERREENARLREDIAAEREARAAELRQMSEDRQTKALFEATLAHIQDGVAVLDERWNVILANAADAEMFGFDHKQLVGMSRATFLAHLATLTDDPEDLLRRMQKPAPDGDEDEFVFARPRRRVLRRTVKPVNLPVGTGRLVIWHDITEHHDLIAERNREALTDALTGIANRRAAEHALRRDQSRAERAGTKLSVALFDIDHFKSVNDRFGHNAGDEVLRRVAATFLGQIRLTDVVARWGGEEFIAVLPVALAGARVFCERVRQAIERLSCPGIGPVTVSAGVVEFGAGEGYAAAVGRADACLYEAKRDGRNRVNG